MPLRRRTIVRIVLPGISLLFSACAFLPPDPAFVVALPAANNAPAGASASGPGPAERRLSDLTRLPRRGTIAVIGDLQMTPGLVRKMRGREYNMDAQRALVGDLQSHAAELGALVVVGDLVFTARSRSDWAHFDDLVAPIAAHAPVFPAIGNHDYYCILVQLCWQSVVPKPMRMRFPWLAPGEPYSVSKGDLLLLFLDSETNLEAQAQWLRDRLESASLEHTLALVFFHRPPYSDSIDRGADGNTEIQELIVPVLRESPVKTVVINGHVHGYEHLVVNGIRFITSAGGGGPRGPLGSERPGDVYRGRECPGPNGMPLRPFNYLLIRDGETALAIEVRGFCSADEPVEILETITVEKPR